MLATFQDQREPDILEVISDLSNDEVFTPPVVAKQMLDLLPPEVWADPSLRWIDPFTKTGVFLREITKRLLVGLKDSIPNDQERLEHILREMVFGVAITELTSLMSRRSLYCSKWADSDRAVVQFQNRQGNLLFTRVEHEFFKGRCSECLAGESQHGGGLETENYAYALLHIEGRRFIEKEIGLKFDVVVGNPPYQMDGGGGGTNATPLYNLFVEQAKALSPQHIVMITPSRWMAGGRGLEEFRQQMLNDKRVASIVDYPVASQLFPGVEVKGGVSYFLWSAAHSGDAQVTLVRGDERSGPVPRKLDEFDVFVRDSRALPILRKVLDSGRDSLETIVSGDTPFGLPTNFKAFDSGSQLKTGQVWVHVNKQGDRIRGLVDRSLITKNVQLIDKWKVLLPKAGSDGGQKLPDMVLGRPLIAEPNSVCTQTYLVLGPLATQMEAESAVSYFQTRFFRFLVSLRKISQDALKSTYRWVPLMEFDRNWDDKQLNQLFGLDDAEVEYISSMVQEMNL